MCPRVRRQVVILGLLRYNLCGSRGGACILQKRATDRGLSRSLSGSHGAGESCQEGGDTSIGVIVHKSDIQGRLLIHYPMEREEKMKKLMLLTISILTVLSMVLAGCGAPPATPP